MKSLLNNNTVVIKRAVAFFFLFFLHGTFKRRTELSHIAYNLDIESMLIHPQLGGIETIKTKNNGNNGKGTQGKND